VRKDHYYPGTRLQPEVVEQAWSNPNAQLVFLASRNFDGSSEQVVSQPSTWTPEVVDDMGQQTLNHLYFTGSDPLHNLKGTNPDQIEHPAWHRVLRVPWTTVEALAGPLMTDPPEAYFLTQLTVRRRTVIGPDAYYHRWTVLKVRRDHLPRFAAGGENDRYFDAHTHAIAEGAYTPVGVSEDLTVPAKDWGSPLVMLAESAYAQALIDKPSMAPDNLLDPSNVSNKIIITDHNQFYSTATDKIPRTWHPATGPTAAAGTDNHQEFTLMQQTFGRGASEEVTVQGGDPPVFFLVPTGRHMLAYDANHIEGPWHGDPADNPNTVTAVLNALSFPRSASIPASAFPAHPFMAHTDLSSPQWRFADLEQLFGLWPYNTSIAFSPDAFKAPIGRGYQIWNQKYEGKSAYLSPADFQRIDPWDEFRTSNGTPDWVDQMNVDLRYYGYLVQQGLDYVRSDAPDNHTIRKLYGVGGTDAHGDFNFSHYSLSAILTNQVPHWAYRKAFGQPATFLYDNAWAKVRTYALGTDSTPGSALDGMMHGRAVVTDGPLILLDLDADPRLSSDSLDFDLSRTSFDDQLAPDAGVYFNPDGQMGGGGPMEGQRTALILMPAGSTFNPLAPAPFVRWRVAPPTGYRDKSEQIYQVGVRNLTDRPQSIDYDEKSCFTPYIHDFTSVTWFVDGQDYHAPLWSFEAPAGLHLGAAQAIASTSGLGPVGGNCRGPQPYVSEPTAMIGITNPVWWAMARGELKANARCTATGSTLTDARLTVTFPISMSAPTNVFLQPLDANGRSTGTRVAAPPSGIVLKPEPGFAGRRLTVEWKNLSVPLTQSSLGQAGHAGAFVAVIADPKDIEGNTLNPVAMVRLLDQCTQGLLCCEMNPPGLATECWDVHNDGMCTSCGGGCDKRSTCASDMNGGYFCKPVYTPGTCVPPGNDCTGGCCVSDTCYTSPATENEDFMCGGCGIWCSSGQHCCNNTCVAFGDKNNCGACGAPCTGAQTCCPQGNQTYFQCVDVTSDVNNCGACGRTCEANENCCGGLCIRQDDQKNCGGCGMACQVNQRCCVDSVSNIGCQAIDTNLSCGACGRGCGTNETCVDLHCKPN
jgi:hypothetical protein